MSSSRPLVVGPDDGPSSPPYPYLMEGKVISGFGRGSKEVSVAVWVRREQSRGFCFLL